MSDGTKKVRIALDALKRKVRIGYVYHTSLYSSLTSTRDQQDLYDTLVGGHRAELNPDLCDHQVVLSTCPSCNATEDRAMQLAMSIARATAIYGVTPAQRDLRINWHGQERECHAQILQLIELLSPEQLDAWENSKILNTVEYRAPGRFLSQQDMLSRIESWYERSPNHIQASFDQAVTLLSALPDVRIELGKASGTPYVRVLSLERAA